jgi:hypothetical protein
MVDRIHTFCPVRPRRTRYPSRGRRLFALNWPILMKRHLEHQGRFPTTESQFIVYERWRSFTSDNDQYGRAVVLARGSSVTAIGNET